MIVSIRGTLLAKEPTRAVIEAGGIGYEVFIPISTFDKLPKTGEEVRLLAYHSVREDDETLFGFATKGEKAMFMKLVGVSGVGNKIALSILSGSSTGELSLAISTGDAKRIAAIKGVGKKTAEKICIELKDKIDAIEALAESQGGAKGADKTFIQDAILALGALGFNDETANKMISQVLAVRPETNDTETLIRLALKNK